MMNQIVFYTGKGFQLSGGEKVIYVPKDKVNEFIDFSVEYEEDLMDIKIEILEGNTTISSKYADNIPSVISSLIHYGKDDQLYDKIIIEKISDPYIHNTRYLVYNADFINGNEMDDYELYNALDGILKSVDSENLTNFVTIPKHLVGLVEYLNLYKKKNITLSLDEVRYYANNLKLLKPLYIDGLGTQYVPIEAIQNMNVRENLKDTLKVYGTSDGVGPVLMMIRFEDNVPWDDVEDMLNTSEKLIGLELMNDEKLKRSKSNSNFGGVGMKLSDTTDIKSIDSLKDSLSKFIKDEMDLDPDNIEIKYITAEDLEDINEIIKDGKEYEYKETDNVSDLEDDEFENDDTFDFGRALELVYDLEEPQIRFYDMFSGHGVPTESIQYEDFKEIVLDYLEVLKEEEDLALGILFEAISNNLEFLSTIDEDDFRHLLIDHTRIYAYSAYNYFEKAYNELNLSPKELITVSLSTIVGITSTIILGQIEVLKLLEEGEE